MTESEQQLIEKAQNGDQSAFADLYKAHHGAIYRFVATKVSFRHEAEDLTHEVFLSAWRNVASFKMKGFPFSSWLYRIARNKVIDHYRVVKQTDDIEKVDKQFIAISEDIDLALDQRAAFEDVSDKLKQLPADQQDVLTLRFIEDMEYEEIAEVIKKSPGNVRTIQHRAIAKLKKLLEDDK